MTKIKVGDIVKVNFNNAQITLCSEALVLSIPCATGDSWVFKQLSTGELHYVSEGCTITKIRAAEAEGEIFVGVGPLTKLKG